MTADRTAKHSKFNVIQDLRVDCAASTVLCVRRDTGERVVIRELDLSATRHWSWDWLAHELDVVAGSRLPHLVPVRVASKSRDEAVLVRQFVAARDILEWAAQDTRPTLDDHLEVMCELFFALAQLHQMGIAHGGIKPSNVMILGQNGKLALLDASVTRTLLAATAHRADFVDGRYLLPTHDTGPTHRMGGFTRDIFAAGWVLLEAVAEINHTGSALRSGAGRGSMNPDALASLCEVIGVPAPLRSNFVKLLSPLPEYRFESAEDVLAAFESVLAIGVETAEQPVTAAGVVGSPAYVEPPLVGRHDELGTLKALADRARRGDGGVVSVTGESGIGKSRLLDVVAADAEQSGVAVLRGGAFDHAAQRPLGLFAEPLRSIAGHLSQHPGEADRVGREMGELLPCAVGQVPGLAQVFANFPLLERGGEPFQDESAGHAAFAIARLIGAVFTADHPGLLMVDDCQWADDLSWQVLEKVASAISNDRARAHTSLICATRPEAVAQMTAWGLDQISFLELQPLNPSCTEQMIRSIGDGLPGEIVRYVIKHSAGNPLETLSIFRALVDSSALARTRGSWVLDERQMRALPLLTGARLAHGRAEGHTSEADVFVAARLGWLSTETQEAISQAAVLGRRFATALLSRALGISMRETRDLLKEAKERGILRCSEGMAEKYFEFTHDRLREAVLRPLDNAFRNDLHRAAAQALQAAPDVSSDYEIAYHLYQSGQVAAALPYALRAGEAGLRQNALDVAGRNFEIAKAGLELVEVVDDEDRFRIYEGLGTVHMLLAEYDVAADELAIAHELSGTLKGLESARIAGLLGELSFKIGRLEEAAKWMRHGIEDLGLRLPASSLSARALCLREIVLLSLWPVIRRTRRRRARTEAERAGLAARIYNRIVYEWWWDKSPVWLMLGTLRALRYALASGSGRERAQAYASAAACIGGILPVLARIGLRLAFRSLRLREQAGDDWGIAQSQHFRGFVLHCAGRYDEAIATFDTAIAAFDVFGDRWEQIAAKWQKALCFYRQGKLHDAGVLARETYWEAKRIGDRIGAGTSLAIWVRCLPGDVKAETISRELWQTNPDDYHTTAMLQMALGLRLTHSDDYDHAVEAFEKAAESIRRSGIKNLFVAPIGTAHLYALRMWRDSVPAWWDGERRRRSAAVRRALVHAVASAVVFHAERPSVLREWAIMSLARGHRKRGRLILRAAARSAARAGAVGDLAACSLVAERAAVGTRGKLGRLPSAEDLCVPLGIRVDRGIVEAVPSGVRSVSGTSSRRQALLDAVGTIVASTDVQDTLGKLRAAIVATTSARRVEVIGASESTSASLPATPSSSVAVGEHKELKRTERIAKLVEANGFETRSVVAAFPLGEGNDHEATVEVLAALAGAVIEREGLRRKSMRLIVDVQEAERDRIARDLHDEFGHVFASIMDRIGTLERSDDSAVRGVAVDVRKIVRHGADAVRAIAWTLRPSGLDDLGLRGCIEQFVEDCRRIFAIRIEFMASGNLDANPSFVETAVYRIVQEALTNIGKHSRASEASVVLVASGSVIRVLVEDDGIGFDAESIRQHRSLGITGMWERAHLIGGTLMVQSQPGKGTTVRLEAPIDHD